MELRTVSQLKWESQFPKVLEECPTCQGRGEAECEFCGTSGIECSYCEGTGKVQKDYGYYRALKKDEKNLKKWCAMMDTS